MCLAAAAMDLDVGQLADDAFVSFPASTAPALHEADVGISVEG